MTLFGYTFSLLYGVLCLALSVVAYKLGMEKRYTRKIVHILVGFEWVILNHFFGPSLNFLAVCLIFTALLAVSYRKKLFVMISSDSDNAPGTVYYGLSMTAMATASLFLDGFVYAFGIAVVCTSVGDGLAGVLGGFLKRFNVKIYKNKTLVGTFAAFIFSLLSTVAFSHVYSLGLTFGQASLIALLAAGLELISGYGLDNVTLPLGTSALAYLIMIGSNVMQYIVPIVLTPFVIALVLSARLLTPKGVMMAVVLDVVVSVSLGNLGFVLLLSFLLLSVLIDKIKKKLKKSGDDITKKTGARDSIQVVANGIIPAAFALLYFITGSYVCIIAYVTALAECFADTAASGFGMLSKRAFDVFKMKKVEVGMSGGMSAVGTLSSLAAALLLSAIAIPFGAIDAKIWLLCSACAFLGAIVDSALGSLLQAKYKCQRCAKLTEKEIHCNTKTELLSGVSFIDNDAVNLISTIAASVIAMIGFLAI